MSSVVIRGLKCRYKDFLAVKDFNLEIKSGEFITLLGPSGSGKTSVLRCIGGYIAPSEGTIEIDGRDITKTAPQRRNIGMVFQNYALFPHMRVFDNIAYGLRVRKLSGSAIRERVAEAVTMVHLEGLEQRYPHELSGGQQQRVALARAIAIRPSVLLMDEPLGALDVRLREALQLEIRRVQRALGITSVYVTHDQSEAFTMSDRIVVMDLGLVKGVGSPEALFYRPTSRFAAEFVGNANVLDVDVVRWDGNEGTVRTSGLDIDLKVVGTRPSREKGLALSVRPEDIRTSGAQSPGSVRGTVTSRRFTGFNVILTVAVGSVVFTVLDPRSQWKDGDQVYLSWDSARAHLIDDVSAQ